MARSRNIKPGFFTNEDLVELDFGTRLLFAGLWTQADKAGRMEDRPKKIKMSVFPADAIDIEPMLAALAGRKFITRYSINGAAYIQIDSWTKHQNPHHTEKESVIPPCPNGALTVKSQEPDGGNPADSLIPDSLNSDSLQEPTALSASGEASPRVVRLDRGLACPYERLLAVFHEECLSLKRVMKLNDSRRKHLHSRWREVDSDSKFQSIDDGVEVFRSIFAKVNRSDFLAGRAKDWKASFDWITQSSTNFLKVCEGHYDNEKRAAK